MSYRNPGDIQIADPSAFMNAFNSVIEPYKAKLEQKAEEKKKLLEKYDAANAKLTASMNYPSWVEKYGSTKAAAIKQMVEEDYIQNNRFASASLSDQQAMLDEIQTNIVQGVKNLDAAVSLDFREILPSHLDNWTSTNKEFTEFLASKPDDSNDITIERQNGELGFSYTVDGQKKFISQSKMPKGIASYKGKTAVNQELQAILDANAKDLDDKFSKAPDMTGVDSYIKSKVASVYANIKSDPAKLETIWENLQIDFNGKEEGTGYSYSDIMNNPELAKDKKVQAVIQDSITGYIYDRLKFNSEQLPRLEGREREKQERANEVYQAKLASTMKAEADTAEKEAKYKKNLYTFLSSARTVGFAFNEDGTVKNPKHNIIFNNATQKRVEQFALANGYSLKDQLVDDSGNVFGGEFKLLGSSNTIEVRDGDTFTDILYKFVLGKKQGDPTTLLEDITEASLEFDGIDMGEFEANQG